MEINISTLSHWKGWLYAIMEYNKLNPKLTKEDWKRNYVTQVQRHDVKQIIAFVKCNPNLLLASKKTCKYLC